MPAIVKKVFFKALIVGFPLLYGCGSDSRPQTAVTDNTKSVKRVNDHKLTALERKNNSERLLKEKGVPVLESLPFIDDYTNARFRNEKDVAAKAIVLFGLIHVANGEKSSTEM